MKKVETHCHYCRNRPICVLKIGTSMAFKGKSKLMDIYRLMAENCDWFIPHRWGEERLGHPPPAALKEGDFDPAYRTWVKKKT